MPPTSKKLKRHIAFECSSICLSVHHAKHMIKNGKLFGLEILMYGIRMENKRTFVFSFFHLNYSCRVMSLF